MFFTSWIRSWKRSIERRWALHQTIRRKSSARWSATRPRLEQLEDRWLLSTYSVTSAADSGAGTLRDAINQANASGGTITEIDFNIGTVGSSHAINLTSQLPTLTASGVFINGLSQGGSGNTTRLITLNGSGAGSSDGLLLQGSKSVVSGLILVNFGKNGIEVDGSAATIGGTSTGAGNIITGNTSDGVLIDSGVSGVLVQGNYVGTNTSGTSQANNVGIEDAGSKNTIGGSVSAARNYISGNKGDGILLDASASGTTVQGNFIGVNSAGSALANSGNGIEIEGAGIMLGGTSSGARNLISGNSESGVLIDSGASGNQVLGNYIGISNPGTAGLANSVGIWDFGASNTIGGSVSGSRNIISGNTVAGIILDTTASGTAVQGNYIGLDASGGKALANSVGIEVLGNNNTIGGASGTNTNFRNYISGNSSDGVNLESSGSGNQVLGNFIGLATNGTTAVGNGNNGIEVGGASNTIGSTSSAANNVISGNSTGNGYGVLLDSVAADKNNVVEGNYIGTDYTGKNALGNLIGIGDGGTSNTLGGSVSGARNIIAGNGDDGIQLFGSGSLVQGNYVGLNVSAAALANVNGIEVIGTDNTIGGTATAARNFISGNNSFGVLMDTGASGNVVLGNYLGTDTVGSAAIANGTGIFISGTNNTVGGTASGSRNVISGNISDGVLLDTLASGNQVLGNYIGVNAGGTGALANSFGVEVRGTNNIIGGTASAARNIISGNSGDGVLLDGTASGNQVQGNYIGTDYTGKNALANSNGIEDAGTSNVLGGSVSGARNVIAGNSNDGVLLDSTASGTAVQGNFIGLGASGTAALTNGFDGLVVGGTNATIGGTVYNARNFISGNSFDGIFISNSGNLVLGNFIGLDLSGTKGVSNLYGVEIGGNGNTIGGTASGAANFISGNTQDGVLIDSGATGNLVLGDYMGTDYTGKNAVANSANGIEITGNGNTVGGTTSAARNIISGNSQDGVAIDSTASGTLVIGNYIGVNVSGSSVNNGAYGIDAFGSKNTIGGTTSGARNVISGNKTDGILLESTASSDLVQGNYIGLDPLGTTAVANSIGIEVAGNNNTIGGTATGTRNYISGNTSDGVLIDSSVSGTQVQGNYIGINPAGNAAVANSVGVEVLGASNTIGGSVSGGRNVISGNSKDGVLLDSTASGIAVQGNIIGLNPNGTAALANGSNGVEVQSINNTIGGTIYNDRNFLSGNKGDGLILDSAASSNQVLGNFIGLGLNGTTSLGNSSNGVEVQSISNTIGGTASGAGNVLSGNSTDGLVLDSSATGNVVLGNYVGTDYTGKFPAGNGLDGIGVSGNNNTLGGTVSAARNIISGNTNSGIVIAGGVTGIQVQGNYIGVNISGSIVTNGTFGIDMFGSNNTIGGLTSGARNIISGNSSTGVVLESTATGITVQGNYIGINAAGSVEGNAGSGIDVVGANNTIGGTASGARNIISGNGINGVLLDTASSGELVQGNYIGLNTAGAAAIGNTASGVVDEGTGNTIGGSVSGARNVISGNGNDGVVLDSSTGAGETVQGNIIGLNAAGNAAVANGADGVLAQAGNNTIGGATNTARNYISANLVDGVHLQSTGNVILGNFIGVGINGTTAMGNQSHGVEVRARSNTIGGTTSGDGNVISGNAKNGIFFGGGSRSSEALGNYIGTDYTGKNALANSSNGIEIFDQSVTIGGDTSAARNIISGNSKNGVLIDSTSSSDQVVGNFIGINVSSTALGNALYGVEVDGSNNFVGIGVAADSNTIAFNTSGGLLIASGSGNAVLENSIYSNGSTQTGPGITVNSGANNNLAAPTLTSAHLSGTTLTVQGNFTPPTANITYVLEFFANPSGDPEGKIFLGFLSVTPTSTSTQNFTFTVTTSVTGTNPLITATLYNQSTSDSSAFSNGVTVS